MKSQTTKSALRLRLSSSHEVLDSRYSSRAIEKLVSSQNQSPYNPVTYYSNLNFLKYSEFLVLIFLLWTASETSLFRRVVLVDLLEKENRIRSYVRNEFQEVILRRFVQRQIVERKPWYKHEREAFFCFVLSKRGLLSLLSDSQVLKSLGRRLKPKLFVPRKPKRVERHRGYRDHGTARPAHRWTEKNFWNSYQYNWRREILFNLQKYWPLELRELINLKPKSFYKRLIE
jgi:hypothetical protein